MCAAVVLNPLTSNSCHCLLCMISPVLGHKDVPTFFLDPRLPSVPSYRQQRIRLARLANLRRDDSRGPNNINQ